MARKNCQLLIDRLMADHAVGDANRIKPGIAEATRAVLRRVPEMVLLRDPQDPEVAHLRHLANAGGIPIVHSDLRTYRAVTIIRNLGGEQE